ncbi:cytochrome bd oxidase small subunit CydS [Sutcliffiella horikoshii]
MENFLIMYASPLIVVTGIFVLFLWGAKGKEKYK